MAHPITTAEQLYRATGLGRCELVRGELKMMTPAGFEHGRIAATIAAELAIHVKRNRLGVVTGAETGFWIAHNPDTVRASDVAFVRAERVPSTALAGYFDGPPDLAVEVVSPSDGAGEVLAKTHEWLASGCRVVWLVDPKTRIVSAYRSVDDVVHLTAADSLDGGDLLPGFAIAVAEIFA